VYTIAIQIRIFRGEMKYVAGCMDLPVVRKATRWMRLPPTFSRRSACIWRAKTSRN